MNKQWKNPLNHPAKQSTMDTPGDFAQFKDLMRTVVSAPPQQVKKQPSASHVPDAS
jgi:hypothetical protein